MTAWKGTEDCEGCENVLCYSDNPPDRCQHTPTLWQPKTKWPSSFPQPPTPVGLCGAIPAASPWGGLGPFLSSRGVGGSAQVWQASWGAGSEQLAGSPTHGFCWLEQVTQASRASILPLALLFLRSPEPSSEPDTSQSSLQSDSLPCLLPPLSSQTLSPPLLPSLPAWILKPHSPFSLFKFSLGFGPYLYDYLFFFNDLYDSFGDAKLKSFPNICWVTASH